MTPISSLPSACGKESPQYIKIMRTLTTYPNRNPPSGISLESKNPIAMPSSIMEPAKPFCLSPFSAKIINCGCKSRAIKNTRRNIMLMRSGTSKISGNILQKANLPLSIYIMDLTPIPNSLLTNLPPNLSKTSTLTEN